MLKKERYDAYIAILKEELIPATGCTEPIAVAYCAAKMREILGMEPLKIDVEVSGNILKNVKSVVVPNTDGRKGIPAAIAVGVIAGQVEKELQVIAEVSAEQKKKIAEYLEKTPITVRCVETPCMLDISVTGYAQGHSACARITNNHTNIVLMKKDDEVLFSLPVVASAEDNMQDKSVLNVADIVEFADTVPFERLKPVLKAQAACNSAIAYEGLKGDWGAQIGKIILEYGKDDIRDEARAYAAAGSDARMSGCELPVVILSGSGNQGITASLPVIRYGKHVGASEEKIYRALAVSDLVTIHQKSGIGRLSAYCGAISAGVGAGAGIAYLLGADAQGVSCTISNAVAILSGTICDGAKPSCAAKIASAVDAGITGCRMYLNHKNFEEGDGIVGRDVEDVISHVGVLASQGMRETDKVILKIMTNC